MVDSIICSIRDFIVVVIMYLNIKTSIIPLKWTIKFELLVKHFIKGMFPVNYRKHALKFFNSYLSKHSSLLCNYLMHMSPSLCQILIVYTPQKEKLDLLYYNS